MSNLTENVTSNFFQGFLERNAPKSKTFEFVLDHPDQSQDVLVFRTTRDHDELRQISIGAVEFGKKVKSGQYTAFLGGIKPCEDIHTLAACYHLARRMVRFYRASIIQDDEEARAQVEEYPLLNELDFLKMATEWPHGFEDIRRTLDGVLSVDVRVREIESVEEAKND
jgi:hypothetical protein